MATEDKNDKTPKLPIHLRFSTMLENTAERLANRKSNKLRQRLDDWAEAETDQDTKVALAEMASQVDEAIENLKTVAESLKALPEDFSKKPAKSTKAKIEPGTICKVKANHVDKYDGILSTTTGLKVSSLRKTHVAVEVGGESYVVPKSHLEAQPPEASA